ncbi:MAG TPA: hypothetical protein VFP25_00330 [Nitrososphaeraceae archaeon]|nr:hypothetical protein [Nitrososphaeraceae archaeon]
MLFEIKSISECQLVFTYPTIKSLEIISFSLQEQECLFIIVNHIICDASVRNKYMCPICKKKLIEHSELQDKICKMITIKQFANNSPNFDVQFRPFFED